MCSASWSGSNASIRLYESTLSGSRRPSWSSCRVSPNQSRCWRPAHGLQDAILPVASDTRIAMPGLAPGIGLAVESSGGWSSLAAILHQNCITVLMFCQIDLRNCVCQEKVGKPPRLMMFRNTAVYDAPLAPWRNIGAPARGPLPDSSRPALRRASGSAAAMIQLAALVSPSRSRLPRRW
jgi:hypothetical protein